MNEIILKLIVFIHIMYILFVVITPFVNYNYFLLLHFICVPFMMLHWLCNDNTCALTIIERNIKKKLNKDYTDDDCFTCKLIEPVYDFKKNNSNYQVFIYGITIFLWLITTCKLYSKYQTGDISQFQDLFRI
jgi:hypothetical protein